MRISPAKNPSSEGEMESNALAERPKSSNYTFSSAYDATTRDVRDHSFSGVMWNVACKCEMPVEIIELTSVWVGNKC